MYHKEELTEVLIRTIIYLFIYYQLYTAHIQLEHLTIFEIVDNSYFYSLI